jgi:hypothetical protein
LRSDEEPELFNSKDFYDYLQPLGTKYLPTSVGSPRTNSTAEKSVLTIKDATQNFFCQEKVKKEWEKYIDYFTQAYNQLISVYGYSPKELIFRYKMPNPIYLLQFWPNTD